MKISVVIPVYNEIDTIEEILARVDKVSIKKEIIVIDDLSIDGTRERLKKIAADKENMKALSFYQQRGFSKTNLNIYRFKDPDIQ